MGLQAIITDVIVRVELLDGRSWTAIVRPSQPWGEIAASQSWLGVVATYVIQGIRHILFGADHMLFSALGLTQAVRDFRGAQKQLFVSNDASGKFDPWNEQFRVRRDEGFWAGHSGVPPLLLLITSRRSGRKSGRVPPKYHVYPSWRLQTRGVNFHR